MSQQNQNLRKELVDYETVNDRHIGRLKWLSLAALGIGLIVLIWSYLNFLCATNIASNSDGANWLLSLFYGDRCKRQSSGINLPSAGSDNDKQQLSLSGTTIELTNGGTIDLSFLTGTPGPAGSNGGSGTVGSNGANGATGPAGSSGPTPPNCLPGELLTYIAGSYGCVTPPTGAVLSAQNGTSLVGTAVELGLNPLLHDTDIPQNGFDLSLTGGVGGSFYQSEIDTISGTTHAIQSGENIFGAPINGTVMLSSPNPAAVPFGGEGSYVFTIDGQVGAGVTDGISEQSNLILSPNSFSSSHNGVGGSANINESSSGVSIGAFDTGTSALSSGNFNTTPGQIDFSTNGGVGGQLANQILDAINGDINFVLNTPAGAIASFDMNGTTGVSQWYNQSGGGNQVRVTSDVATSQFNIYTSDIGSGQLNNFNLDDINGLTFSSTMPPIGPNTFNVSQLGDVTFDNELRPRGNAGNLGEVLISQGAGTAPIWSAAASGLQTANNGLSVNPAGNVQLGNNVGTGLASLLNSREIPQNGFNVLFSGSGKIGIGTTTPDAFSKVNIVNPNASQTLLVESNTTGNVFAAQLALRNIGALGQASRMQFYDGVDLTAGISSQHVGAGQNGNLIFDIRNNTVIQEAMRIDNFGRVGISNNTPGFMLHVGSSTIASGTTVTRFENAGGTCDVTPNIAGGLTCTSDITLKKNIVNYEDGLNTILALNTISYNMLADEDGTQKQIGFSAQDLEQVLPGLVRTDEQGRKSVSYAGLTPVLVDALKKVHQQVETNQINLLAQLAADKADIEGLKTYTGYNEVNTDGPAQDITAADFTSVNARLAKLEASSASSATTQNTTSVATAVFNGGIITGDTTFEGLATFQALATFNGKVVFKSDASFEGHIAVGSDTSGSALLKAGNTKVHITFSKAYTTKPKVTATAQNFLDPASQYRVANVTTLGFDIEVLPAQSSDLHFDYTVLE